VLELQLYLDRLEDELEELRRLRGFEDFEDFFRSRDRDREELELLEELKVNMVSINHIKDVSEST
jgi:hypothetical protein